MSKPLLTIGITYYNTASTLLDLAKTVFSQTIKDWELILVDDGSTDGGHDIVSRIRDSRVRVIRDGQHLGMAARLNQISQLAEGKYLARLDADDLSHPNRFQSQVAFLDEHPEVDVVSCDYLALDKGDIMVGRTRGPVTHEQICSKGYKTILLLHGGIVGRTKWFRENEYPLGYPCCDDQGFLFSSFRHSRFASIPEAFYFYRVMETYKFKKYYLAARGMSRLIWRYGRGHYPLNIVLRAYLGRYVRLGTYAMAELIGLRKRLMGKRYDPIGESDRRMFKEAMAVIRGTVVPGLEGPSTSVEDVL